MGITNEEAARRKKEKEDKEKKKKLKERKTVMAMQKREAKQRKMEYPFYILFSFSFCAPFFVQILQQEQKARRALQTKKGRGGYLEFYFPFLLFFLVI